MNTKQETYKRLKQIIKATETYPQAAKQLNKEGYRTPRKNRWTAQAIATWAYNQRHSKTGTGRARKTA